MEGFYCNVAMLFAKKDDYEKLIPIKFNCPIFMLGFLHEKDEVENGVSLCRIMFSYDSMYVYLEPNRVDKTIIATLNFFNISNEDEISKKVNLNSDDFGCIDFFKDEHFSKIYNIIKKYYQKWEWKFSQVTRKRSDSENVANVENVENVENDFLFINRELSHMVFSLNKKSLVKAYKKNEKFNINYKKDLAFINKNISKNNNNKLMKLINKSFIKNPELYVYNVGQANTSGLFFNSNKIPFGIFDIGNCNNSNVEVENMYRKLDETGFILVSHYDNDHINRYDQLSNKAWKRFFILPEFSLIKLTSTYRKFIDKIRKESPMIIYIKDNSLKGEYLDLGHIRIYQGDTTNMSSYQSTQENTHSLVSLIRFNDQNKALLPGDALYEEFPESEIGNVDYLVLSHHGCKYNHKIEIKVNKGAFVFVRSPSQDKYKHPHKTHIERSRNALSSKNDHCIYRFINNKSSNNFLWNDSSKEIDDKTKAVSGDYMKFEL